MKLSPLGLRRAAALSSIEALAATLTSGYSQPYLSDLPHLRLIDQAFMDGVEGRFNKIGIFMPPRHGKSLRLRWALLWHMATFPDERIIIATASQPLADAHGRWIRNMVRDHGELLGIELDPGSQAAGRLDIKGRDGGMFATSVGGAGTGMGAKALLVDDPVKDRQDAESKTVMDTSEAWWSDVATTRLTSDGFIVLMHTRWSDNDLAARVIGRDPSDWSVVDCPAIAMSADEYASLGIDEPVEDPLGRQPGEALDPARWPVSVLNKRRKDVGETSWWSMFQQQPRTPQGTLLSRDEIRSARVHTVPPAIKAAVAVDPSGGGRDTAGILGGVLGSDGIVYFTDDASGVMSSERWSRAACILAYRMGADTFLIEKNYGGDMGRLALRTAWDRLSLEEVVEGMCPYIREIHAKKGKFLRAEPVAQQIKEGRVRFGPAGDELENEWARWEPTSGFSPGRIDASVYLAMHLVPPPKSSSRLSSPARPAQAKPSPEGAVAAAPRLSPWGRTINR